MYFVPIAYNDTTNLIIFKDVFINNPKSAQMTGFYYAFNINFTSTFNVIGQYGSTKFDNWPKSEMANPMNNFVCTNVPHRVAKDNIQ